jgi:RNA polymerase sigma factor (sigma-70 family)
MAGDLNSAYVEYAADRSDDNLNSLLVAVTRYALGYARRSKAPDPHDLAQDVALKVWRSLASFAAKSSFRTYVHRCCCNRITDQQRVEMSPAHGGGLLEPLTDDTEAYYD